MLKDKTYLITGSAGFIGFHLTKHLLENNCNVIGIDNMNDYYDTGLKRTRLAHLIEHDHFTFVKLDISNKDHLLGIFRKYNPDIVINLSAQAGVRYSLINPDEYIQSNVVGFYNILEGCRQNQTEQLLYASSSSVYGSNNILPFKESDNTDHPLSLYASTKKSNELMAYTYSRLYDVSSIGLRFFTVYGTFGRPDMSYFKFLNKFFSGKPINIFNNGDFDNDLYRDFTYVGDVITVMTKLIKHGQKGHKILNVGNDNPVKLMTFIYELENALSNSLGYPVSFNKEYLPIMQVDVPETHASTEKLKEKINYVPNKSIACGLQEFTDWYINFYQIKKGA